MASVHGTNDGTQSLQVTPLHRAASLTPACQSQTIGFAVQAYFIVRVSRLLPGSWILVTILVLCALTGVGGAIGLVSCTGRHPDIYHALTNDDILKTVLISHIVRPSTLSNRNTASHTNILCSKLLLLRQHSVLFVGSLLCIEIESLTSYPRPTDRRKAPQPKYPGFL
jgi:hypothetical protein